MTKDSEQIVIPEDLRERYATLNTWIRGPVDESTKMPAELGLLSELILIERIAALEAARDDADGRYLACYNELTKVQAENAALKATVERLQAPETEAEWDKHAVSGTSLVRGVDRISFRAILASRVNPPEKEPKP